MKQLVLAVFMVLGVVACSMAGMNPVNLMLPTSTAYGVPLGNNEASTMCVDCHGYSPVENIINTVVLSGTHFVTHDDGTAFRSTNNLNWENIGTGNWVAWSSGALSKYASPAPPDPLTVSVTGVTGEMICESCHNILINVAGGNNLVAAYNFNDDSVELCEGCHSNPAEVDPITGPPRHHPMTGDDVGGNKNNPLNHPLDTSHTTISPAPEAQQYYMQSVIQYVNAGAGLSCASCHDAHGASRAAGARIIKPGESKTTTIPVANGGPVNVVYYDDIPRLDDSAGDVKLWDTGNAVEGIDRQQDITDNFGPGSRLLSNADPLCQVCHHG